MYKKIISLILENEEKKGMNTIITLFDCTVEERQNIKIKAFDLKLIDKFRWLIFHMFDYEDLDNR